MSFNYTPPPPEVIKTGRTLGYIVYASMVFVPKAKLGVLIGSLGCFAISFWVSSHAGGDLGGLSHLINPPVDGVIGACIGGLISLISQSIWRAINKNKNPGNDSPDADASDTP